MTKFETVVNIKSKIYELFDIIRRYNPILLFFMITPAILCAIFIYIYGVSVVYMDSWSRIPMLEHFLSGTLTFSDLFAQANEHRAFFYYLIFLITVYLTHWNVFAEMYVMWILLLFTFASLLYLYSLNRSISKQSLILFLPIPWLLFNFRQWESILQGCQISVYLCQFAVIISLILIVRSEKIDSKFIGALFFATVSAFSFLNGLLIWPIGFLLIFLIKEKRTIPLLVWTAFGIINFGLFFHNWVKPTYHPSFYYIAAHPLEGIEFFILNIGFPLGCDYISSLSIGLILLGLLTYILILVIKNNLFKQNAIWLSLILYSLGSSLMMTIGRSGLGGPGGMTSRYVSFTIIGIIGLYLLLLSIYDYYAENQRNFIYIFSIFVGIILFGIISGNILGIQSAEVLKQNHEESANYLIGYSTATDEQLGQMFPDTIFLKKYAPFLEINRLNVFYLPEDKLRLNKPVNQTILPGQPFFTGNGKINNKNEYIIFEHPLPEGRSIFYFDNITVTNRSQLSFDIALAPQIWSSGIGDGVDFQIFINSVANENLIFSQYIDPKHNTSEQKWNPYIVDLSPYVGNNVKLLFSTLPGPNNDSSNDWAWWGNPMIINIT